METVCLSVIIMTCITRRRNAESVNHAQLEISVLKTNINYLLHWKVNRPLLAVLKSLLFYSRCRKIILASLSKLLFLSYCHPVMIYGEITQEFFWAPQRLSKELPWGIDLSWRQRHSLPVDIRSACTISDFIQKLKTFLFSKAFC